MAKKAEKPKSVRRFGPRYGPRMKGKLAEIEKYQRQRQTCPHCLKKAVKKLSLGIWHCRKCDKKFTGKAYTLQKKAFKEEETAE